MKFIYSALLFGLCAPVVLAQKAEPPTTAEDCGCTPGVDTKVAANLSSRAAVVAPQQLDKLIQADSNAIEVYRANQEKTNPTGAAWVKALSSFAAREHASLLVDLGPRLSARPPIIPDTRTRGGDAMRALASAMLTTWKQTNGIQVFARTRGLQTVERQKALATIIDWLKGADRETVAQLSGHGLVLSQAPPEVRRALLLCLPDRDMPFALLDRSAETAVLLRLSPVLTVPATAKRPSISLPLNRSLLPLPGGTVWVPKADPAKSTVQPEPLQPTPKGTLDFGPGVLLPLSEVLAKATASFGATPATTRPPETLLFVSGKYSPQTLQEALDATVTENDLKIEAAPRYKELANQLTTELLQTLWKEFPASTVDTTHLRRNVPQPNEVDGPAKVKAYVEQHGASEGLPAAYFVEGKSMPAGILAAGTTGLISFLHSNGVTDDADVTPRLELSLTLMARGSHTLSGVVMASGGKVEEMQMDNISSFQLTGP